MTRASTARGYRATAAAGIVRTVTDFASYQNEIYLAGMFQETRPERPVGLEDLERAAYEAMSEEARGYVQGGASSADTIRANREAFRRWRLVPRMLTDVATRNLTTEAMGTRMPAPVLLAPVGVQSLVHEEAELAVARAAASLGIPIVLSAVSSKTLEEVAEAAGDTPRWFQLYWPTEPELTESFLSRAESAGYSAVVVTLDTRLLGWRPRDIQRGFLPFLRAEGIANYLSDPVFRKGLPDAPEEHVAETVARWATVFPNPSTTWERLVEIREATRLPVLLKGVLHPDDARRSLDAGVDGLVVSNHGGRQVDGAIAALDALPGVVGAVDGRVPILFDSGIRTGADAVKALALGAVAVLLGRPYIWGLALGGEEGVRDVLRGFLADLDLTLALCGVARPQDVDRSLLVREDEHP
jgi:lactate 2-monooxygenase